MGSLKMSGMMGRVTILHSLFPLPNRGMGKMGSEKPWTGAELGVHRCSRRRHRTRAYSKLVCQRPEIAERVCELGPDISRDPRARGACISCLRPRNPPRAGVDRLRGTRRVSPGGQGCPTGLSRKARPHRPGRSMKKSFVEIAEDSFPGQYPGCENSFFSFIWFLLCLMKKMGAHGFRFLGSGLLRLRILKSLH